MRIFEFGLNVRQLDFSMASDPAREEALSPLRRPTCTWSQLAVLVLLEVLILYTDLLGIGWSQSVCQNSVITKHTGQPVIFGHFHMAKTGGTDLNGELALRFERVCGNKGYSYDAFQANLRFNNSASHKLWRQHDSISKLYQNFNRGRVPPKSYE